MLAFGRDLGRTLAARIDVATGPVTVVAAKHVYSNAVSAACRMEQTLPIDGEDGGAAVTTVAPRRGSTERGAVVRSAAVANNCCRAVWLCRPLRRGAAPSGPGVPVNAVPAASGRMDSNPPTPQPTPSMSLACPNRSLVLDAGLCARGASRLQMSKQTSKES